MIDRDLTADRAYFLYVTIRLLLLFNKNINYFRGKVNSSSVENDGEDQGKLQRSCLGSWEENAIKENSEEDMQMNG